MTANVKIPVASADNVTAVPLAAVFTEKNPDTSQMERFVYVQQGETFEKRNVKVGVSDFTCAEIQEGLKPGDVVSLELPKEEREKKAKQVAVQKKSGGESGTAATKPAAPASGTHTNSTRASATGTAASTSMAKNSSAAIKISSAAASTSPR
jgi:glycine cleavage system H lipoate-binding protein